MQMSKKVQILGNGNAIMLNPYIYCGVIQNWLAKASIVYFYPFKYRICIGIDNLIGRFIIGLVFITSFKKQMVWEPHL